MDERRLRRGSQGLRRRPAAPRAAAHQRVGAAACPSLHERTIRFETTEGRLVQGERHGTAYEAALIALLGELRPGLAPDVIAYDDNRRWSLTRDGGPILRSMVALMRRGRTGNGCCLGTPRRSSPSPSTDPACCQPEPRTSVLRNCPSSIAEALAELTARSTDGVLSQEHASALERLLPAYDSWCAEMATSPVLPDSLQHR